MKNIHILPTDKPSRLIFNSLHKSFCYQKEIDGMYINDGKVSGADFWSLQKALNNGFKPQNIYITSDEEIKEGDWTLMFDDLGNLFLCDKPQQYLGIEKGHHLNKGLRKIILTTDQDLIADGVQAINNEFLEWFVQNPSCEAVKVEYQPKDITEQGEWIYDYKITIPKEESKQETLEEVAERLYPENIESIMDGYHDSNSYQRESFINGYKLAQERSYSEEEVIELLLNRPGPYLSDEEIKEWFEQFKNK